MSLPPPPHGRYSVGALRFSGSVNPRVEIGTGSLANAPDSAGLKLDEVSFTAFYPAVSSKDKNGIYWLPRPLGPNVRGYAVFGGVASWLVWLAVHLYAMWIKIPVYENALLLEPPESKGGQWPLIIFSHGLGGTWSSYSQICTRLAAEGNVVLALEHRDGTAPVDGKGQIYIREKDVQWKDEEELKYRLRMDQLEFRLHELYRTYQLFSSFVEDSSPDLKVHDDGSWRKKVRYSEDVRFAGHSFGGCTVLSFLSSPPPSSSYVPIPVTKCLIYDPWLDPLATPGPLTPSQDMSILVINSQQFTLWTEHFTQVMQMVEKHGGSLITLVKSTHMQFSDFLLLPLIPGKQGASTVMDRIEQLSIAFLNEHPFSVRRAIEHQGLTPRKMVVTTIPGKKDKYGEPKRDLEGRIGDIILH